jgi:alkylation response protein AidB-like acyl-CoA dehydrogenase
MAGPALVSDELLAALSASAEAADGQPVWPTASWDQLAQSGVLGWMVPPSFGGSGRSAAELLDGYAALAGACLTTCFILSQREAAVRRIVDSDRPDLCEELLPSLARGTTFATVGISQLTTSRQHGAPAMRVQLTADTILLDGIMPWVTGAPQADYFLTGGVLDDGLQVLAVLPAKTPGVTVGPPLPLMALQGSLTAEVRCDNVSIDRRWLLAGPTEKVMAGGRGGGTGGLETSCLALGLAGAAIALLEREATVRLELRQTAERLAESRRPLYQRMHELAAGVGRSEGAVELRSRANELVLRATQAALTASKGAGFLHGHPAQRWARQALFFLVWSCPRPVTEATLAYLRPGPVDPGTCGG